MKNITIFLGLFFVGFSFAQSNMVNILLPTTNNKYIKFGKNWKTMFNLPNKQLILSEGIISNNSVEPTGFIKVEYYFMPNNTLTQYSKGYLLSSYELNAIPPSSSKTNISLIGDVLSVIPDNSYYPLMIFYEKQNGEYIPVDYSFQNKRALVVSEENVSFSKEKTKFTELVVVDNQETLILQIKKEVTIDGNWEINIDYENFLIDISGGVLTNLGDITSPIQMDLYLTEEKFSPEAEGFVGHMLASAPLEITGTVNEITNTKIKMNLNKIIPTGIYYPLLVLSETNDKGVRDIRAVRIFNNKIQL